MKKLIPLILMLIFFSSCTPQNNMVPKPKSEMKPEKNTDGEWELLVIDSQYDYFLNAIAKPKNMYSESYLKNKNVFLVSEWNSLYLSNRYPNVIESSIVYDAQENYGFKFEYRLYQVFAYVQWKYGVRLNGLSGSEVR